jgi:hypothetical protein
MCQQTSEEIYERVQADRFEVGMLETMGILREFFLSNSPSNEIPKAPVLRPQPIPDGVEILNDGFILEEDIARVHPCRRIKKRNPQKSDKRYGSMREKKLKSSS